MPYLITVGVISAQKNTLRLPTACDENIPTMEKAVENLSFTVSLIPIKMQKEIVHFHSTTTLYNYGQNPISYAYRDDTICINLEQ